MPAHPSTGPARNTAKPQPTDKRNRLAQQANDAYDRYQEAQRHATRTGDNYAATAELLRTYDAEHAERTARITRQEQTFYNSEGLRR